MDQNHNHQQDTSLWFYHREKPTPKMMTIVRVTQLFKQKLTVNKVLPQPTANKFMWHEGADSWEMDKTQTLSHPAEMQLKSI